MVRHYKTSEKTFIFQIGVVRRQKNAADRDLGNDKTKTHKIGNNTTKICEKKTTKVTVPIPNQNPKPKLTFTDEHTTTVLRGDLNEALKLRTWPNLIPAGVYELEN